MNTNPGGTTHYPLKSEDPAFNRLVAGTKGACADLEAGKVNGKEFNQRYQGAQDTYLIELGIMSDPRRRV